MYGDPRLKKHILGWDEPWIYNILSLCEEDTVLSYDIKNVYLCGFMSNILNMIIHVSLLSIRTHKYLIDVTSLMSDVAM